ncbi:MAG TPA: hypothetical protein VGP99_08730 [Tepidisphaeraceae bacterium]|jgi:hypothetical protein|nr:hypothetical protein [Tepidisphaeraceae bacterium]
MEETGPNNPDSVPPSEEFVVHDDLPKDDDLPPQSSQDDLDNKRIRQIARLRRSAVRSRGYLLIGGILCAVLGMQLIWNSISRFRGGLNVVGSAYLMAAAILFALAWRAFLRSQQLKREAAASTLSDPKTPPDFSRLSDGSQSWKNLEDM